MEDDFQLLALLLVIPVVAMMASGWVLIRAVGRLNREGLPVMEIVAPTSMTLGAISLAGWVMISVILKTVLWAPILAIPVTTPFAVIAGAFLVIPHEVRNSWGGAEYHFSYNDFTIAGGLVALVALLPQLYVAVAQLG